MRLTFLGTGTSYGVPYVGCRCAVCHSDDPRDKRLRASILVDDADTRILVDTGPDLRAQCLRAHVHQLSAILYTHWHNDHIIGLDDIRPLTDRQGYIAAYAGVETMERLASVFDYIFIPSRDHAGFPRVSPHVLEPNQTLEFGDITATPRTIFHGKHEIFAYEFQSHERRVIYATDCSGIPPETMEIFRGCDVFIVDALRQGKHPNHFSVSQALAAAREVGAPRTFFTHITHELPHAQTQADLPQNVEMAYDGLRLEI